MDEVHASICSNSLESGSAASLISRTKAPPFMTSSSDPKAYVTFALICPYFFNSKQLERLTLDQRVSVNKAEWVPGLVWTYGRLAR